MILNDLGITGETWRSVRKSLMPDWRHCDALPPTIGKVGDFYFSKGLTMIPRGDLACNPLAILRQSTGVFHLSTTLTLQHSNGTTTRKHACVYNASKTFQGKAGRGVLRDNQKEVDALLIEDTDRVDKASALKAFHSLWPDCSKVLIVAVHEIKK